MDGRAPVLMTRTICALMIFGILSFVGLMELCQGQLGEMSSLLVTRPNLPSHHRKNNADFAARTIVRGEFAIDGGANTRLMETGCNSWQCSCQFLSDLTGADHNLKSWGTATDEQLRWWLNNECKTSPVKSSPKSMATDRCTLASRNPQSAIVGMGLPKTGTTSTAVALQNAGMHVAHNQGDRLSKKCNVIINTMEDQYETLAVKHPNASWIVTWTWNATAWYESVQKHVRHVKKITQHDDVALPCNFYGCEKGLPEGDRDVVMLSDHERAIRAYHLYYSRLFAFLAKHKSGKFALVDVRSGIYSGLYEMTCLKLKTPFEARNTADNRGQWPKC
jgi:hypothetical protein